MKKNIILSLIGLILLTACKNNHPKPIIGGNKDEYGCLTSAGQTWSELKQSCIQVFNEGKRLNPIDHKENTATISAFVLFNDDHSKAELFLPDEHNIILDKVSNQIYQKGEVKYDKKNGTLYQKGVATYQKERK